MIINENVFIVIPAYNEASRLGHVVAELRRNYPHVVVVYDASSDETGYVARQHGCIVLRHVINRGQGASLRTGITYSLRKGAKFIVTFDADGQHQASDLAAMLRPVIADEVDVTLGSRFLSKTSNVPFSRRIVLQIARLFTWVTSGVKLSDCHNGFRVLSRCAARKIHLHQDRMAHASEFYDQIWTARLSYKEIPISIYYSAESLIKGQSSFNSISILFHYLFGKIVI